MEKPDPIKILQVVGTLRTGGVEKLVYDLTSKINSHRFAIEICCAREQTGQFLEPVRNSGVPVHFFGDYRRNPGSFFSRYRAFLAATGFDVVHSHLNHWSGLFLYTPYKLGVPVRIVHYHNDFSSHKRFTVEYALRKFFGYVSEKYSNTVLGISDACLNSVYGSSWKDNPKVKRIYNGIDLTVFSSIQSSALMRKELGISDGCLVIGHVGQFRKQKNHTFILSLAEKLCARNKKVVFLLVGDGPLLEQVREDAAARGLENRILFTGTRTDIQDLMGIMDIFVFPSLWEGFGMAVVEAQAAGLPVIMSTNIPDEIPLITPSVKLPLDDIEAWNDACKQLIEYVRKNDKRKKSLPRKLEQFSLDTWIRNIERIYSRAYSG